MLLAHRSRSSHSPARGQARGFTLMEMIVVIVISGVLAAVVLPKFDVATSAGGRAYADSVKAGLRYARSVAVGHRRLVCVDFDANSRMVIEIATVNPATVCDAVIDGQSVFASPPAGITAAWSTAGKVYFQPNGRLTSDGAGTLGINKQVNITGETAINVEWFGRVE